ncbi:MAG: hypothetical protein ACOYU7_08430 [Bacillota bacterium]
MAVMEKDLNGKVRRMVRTKAAVRRSGGESKSSWACVRAAGATEEPPNIGYRPPRSVYAGKAPIFRRTHAREIDEPIEPPRVLVALWEKASRLPKATRRVVSFGERKGYVVTTLVTAVIAFVGGLLIAQYVFNPVVPLLAYLAVAQATVEEWLSPATRSTLVSGGILVGIGLWLVFQMLRRPAGAVQRAARRDKPVIPKEMLDRHA